MSADDSDGARRPPTPRWVKVFGVLGVLVAVLVILRLTGIAGEGHGPARHGGERGIGGVDSAQVGAHTAAS